MKYTNIKAILKKQCETGVQTFWTFDKDKQEFTQIYKNYNDKLPIFTPQQLLDKLNE
jgi:hypothetical protein